MKMEARTPNPDSKALLTEQGKEPSPRFSASVLRTEMLSLKLTLRNQECRSD